MEAIAIELISIETIKPQLNDDHRPFKICLLDQITPRTYVPVILFFHNIENATVDRLKTSLAEALTAFYPFSGRLAGDNLFVVDFHAGVPFKTARLDCPMSVFLNRGTHMPTLNQFLPFRPFCNEKSTPDMPQVAVQLTRFSCGGGAVGVCTSHKLADIATCVGFLNGWAAITRSDDPASASRYLDLHGGAWRFPAVEGLTAVYEDVLFDARGRDMRTERFVFDEEALARLKSEAKSDVVSSPSRVQSLAAFIWKSAVAAAITVSSSSSSRAQVMNQIVSIRPRNLNNEIGPTTDTAVGNLYICASAISNNNEWGNPNLSELAKLGSESVSKVNNDCMRSVRGNEAVDLVLGELKKTEMLLTCEDVPELLSFSSWVNMGLKDVDFGFGKPKWVAVYGGEGGPELTNCVVLNDTTWCNGIEAWVNIDSKVLDALKNDREFLAFAVVDPPVIG